MKTGKFLGVVLLLALVANVSCKKTASSSTTDPSALAGTWLWQYTVSGLPPGQDTLYPEKDSTIELTFSLPNSFTVLVNGNLRFGGTFTLSDTLLTVTPSAKDTVYAWETMMNGTIPSEYLLSIHHDTIALSKHFIIPGATGPYSVPAEPQVMYFIQGTVFSVSGT